MAQIKFKDVAHLYLGCSIFTGDGKGSIKSVRDGELTVDFRKYKNEGFTDEKGVKYDFVYHENEYIPNDCTPYLYPLSSMTETQRIEIFPSDENQPLPEFIKTLESDFFLYPDQFLKLLSYGFDLFGLIESKQAFDATLLVC